MKRRNDGFTMLELLVTVAIIFTLAALLLAGASMARRAARNKRSLAAIEELATACDSYYSDHHAFPYADPSSLGFGSVLTPAFYGDTEYYDGGWTYRGRAVAMVWMLSKARQPEPYINLTNAWYKRIEGMSGPDGRDLYTPTDGHDTYIRIIRDAQYYEQRVHVEIISAGPDTEFGDPGADYIWGTDDDHPSAEDNMRKNIKR